MLFVVEVRVGADDLFVRMSNMRQWLDHRRFEPDLFRYDRGAYGAVVRVEFKYENEAFVFAEAFGGAVLRDRSPA